MATANPNQDTLPNTVPKLDPDGSNWVMYRIRFMAAVKAKGKWGHFDGTTPHPVPAPPAPAAAGGAAAPAAPPAPADVQALATWDADEASALYLLLQRISERERNAFVFARQPL